MFSGGGWIIILRFAGIGNSSLLERFIIINLPSSGIWSLASNPPRRPSLHANLRQIHCRVTIVESWILRNSCDESRTQLWVTEWITEVPSSCTESIRQRPPPGWLGSRDLGDHIIIIMGVCCVLWIIQTRTSFTGPSWQLNLRASLRSGFTRIVSCLGWSSSTSFWSRPAFSWNKALEAPPRLWRPWRTENYILCMYIEGMERRFGERLWWRRWGILCLWKILRMMIFYSLVFLRSWLIVCRGIVYLFLKWCAWLHSVAHPGFRAGSSHGRTV